MKTKVRNLKKPNGLHELSADCPVCGKTHKQEHLESLGMVGFHFECCEQEESWECKCIASEPSIKCKGKTSKCPVCGKSPKKKMHRKCFEATP